MRMFRFLAVIGLLLTILSGCQSRGADAWNAPTKASIDRYEPKKLVETYFQALGHKDYETSKACLSDEWNAKYPETFLTDDDSKITGIKDLKLKGPANIPLYGKSYKEVQVAADFHVEYKTKNQDSDGLQIRFVYVAKKTKNSPWKIISVGTGP